MVHTYPKGRQPTIYETEIRGRSYCTVLVHFTACSALWHNGRQCLFEVVYYDIYKNWSNPIWQRTTVWMQTNWITILNLCRAYRAPIFNWAEYFNCYVRKSGMQINGHRIKGNEIKTVTHSHCKSSYTKTCDFSSKKLMSS